MGAGFQVFASDGSLMVDSDMISWFCAKSGVGQTTTRDGVGNTVASVANIDVSGYTYALSAIRIHGDSYAAARGINAWNSGNHRYATNAPIGTNFTWYVFDYAPRLPAINAGLETYRQDGQRSFSSAFIPFKPLKDLTGGGVTFPGHELAISGPSFAGYGAVAGSIKYYKQNPGGSFSQVVPEDSPTHYGYTRDCKLYGDKVMGPSYAVRVPVSFDDVTPQPAPLPENPKIWNVPGPVLAVDVTNIPVPATFF